MVSSPPTLPSPTTSTEATPSSARRALARTALARSATLGQLPHEVLEALAEGATWAELATGQRLAAFDRPPAALWLVCRGRIAMQVTHPSGREIVVDVVLRGDLLGEGGLIEPDGSLGVDAVAAERDTVVLAIPWSLVASIASRSPMVRDLLHRRTLERYRRSITDAAARVCDPVELRLVRLILDLDVRAGHPTFSGARTIGLEITQTQLASMVGATRKAIVDALRDLRAAGLVLHDRRRIRILDPERLAIRADRHAAGGSSGDRGEPVR